MTIAEEGVAISDESAQVPTPRTPKRSRLRRTGQYLASSNQVVVAFYGLIIALVVGGVLLTFSTPPTLHAVTSLFDHPGASFATIFSTIGDTYRELFTGSIIDPAQLAHSISTNQQWALTFTPLSETLVNATPLIVAGLGIGIAFETGVFNIGGASQVTMGAVAAAYVGADASMPAPWHVIACLLAGLAGGALAGAVPGVLKALTGAHEVIVTIMFNYVVGSLLIWVLETPWLGLQAPNQGDTISKAMPSSVSLPHLFGPNLRVDLGLPIALAAAVIAWWLLDRSTMGFRFRMTGASPSAARTAGVDAKRTTILVFLVSGAFVGLAGTIQLVGFDNAIGNIGPQGYQGAIGFTAITVALLGRNRPIGIVFGSVLIGALVWGAFQVEAQAGISPDLTNVIQGVMLLCVATPALVAHIFRLRPGTAASFKFGGWGT